MKVCCT